MVSFIFKTLKLGLPPYFSQYFVPYTCKISTRRSVPSKNMLNPDIILSIEILTNPGCTLKIDLLLAAHRYGIASLKNYVMILYILFGVN